MNNHAKISRHKTLGLIIIGLTIVYSCWIIVIFLTDTEHSSNYMIPTLLIILFLILGSSLLILDKAKKYKKALSIGWASSFIFVVVVLLILICIKNEMKIHEPHHQYLIEINIDKEGCNWTLFIKDSPSSCYLSLWMLQIEDRNGNLLVKNHLNINNSIKYDPLTGENITFSIYINSVENCILYVYDMDNNSRLTNGDKIYIVNNGKISSGDILELRFIPEDFVAVSMALP